jgi:hypothetical protein
MKSILALLMFVPMIARADAPRPIRITAANTKALTQALKTQVEKGTWKITSLASRGNLENFSANDLHEVHFGAGALESGRMVTGVFNSKTGKIRVLSAVSPR